MNPYDLGRALAATFLTEATPVTKVVAVFAGRFQPFHAGHYADYQALAQRFGSANTFIATSNVTDPPRSPFSFAEKKKIITTLFGVPADHVQQVKNPFQPTEIIGKFSPKTTAYVTAFSAKDAGRLGGKYFQEYPRSGTPKDLLNYEDGGYFLITPEVQGISGTKVRAVFANANVSVADKKAEFRKMYGGKFDQAIFDLFLHKIGGSLAEGQSMISRVLIEKYHANQWRHRMLREGGAAGHLAHPFEDTQLTFGDLKQIIELGLSGELNVEAPLTEKLDGQNISVSYRADKGVIFARNKSHIKDRGLNAMPVSGVKQMFAGRGDVSDAFSLAATDLERAVLSLTEKQREKVFGDGSKFMSVEIIYPATQNVIPYGLNMLVMHTTIEFDAAGNAVSTESDSGRMFAGMIKQINQDVQDTFAFRGPVVVSLPRAENFSRQKAKYVGRLNRLQSQFHLSDAAPVVTWHQQWWEDFIVDQAAKMKYAMPNYVLEGLVKRWAYMDPGAFSVAAMRSQIKSPEFLSWVLTYDKTDQAAQAKRNLQPFEMLFLDLGADILQNARGLISVSPGEGAAQLRKDLDAAVRELSGTTDVKKLARVRDNIQKITALGTERLVPSEGIVFLFHGKMYKLTGIFAPLNQLLGLLRF